jgi:hypothetical protein
MIKLKLTFAVLHDEDFNVLHDEEFLARHDVGVFQLLKQSDFKQIDLIKIRADLRLLSDVFLFFCFVGHQVSGPKTIFVKPFVLGVF